jgi:molybdopterin/thiamine biosynthesis adenylyltransferase
MAEKETHPLKVRFSDAAWYERASQTTVLLLGSGGIGSWVGFALARIGYPFMVYDFDLVEDHNLGGQLFNTSHVGMLKTEALEEVVKKFSGQDVTIYRDGKYTDKSPSNPVIIAAFDNMAARKLAFEKWEEALNEAPDEDKNEFIFIDGRLLAEDYRIYAVTSDKDRVAAYKTTLFSDDVQDNIQCTLKATTHCSMSIAGDIIGVLNNHIAGIDELKQYGAVLKEIPAQIIRSYPMFSYDISNNIECLT